MTAKLSFAFPSQPKPGYVAGSTPPEIDFRFASFPSETYFMLTVGVVDMDKDRPYTLLLRVFLGEEEVTVGNPNDEKQISFYRELTNKSGVNLAYVALNEQFLLKSAGTYRVVVDLHSTTNGNNTIWDKISSIETYFCVSEEWRETDI